MLAVCYVVTFYFQSASYWFTFRSCLIVKTLLEIICFALHSRKPNDSIHFMHSNPSPEAKPLSFLYTLAGKLL
jgi:hypothetical protein